MATAAVRYSAASLGATLTLGDVPWRVAARLPHLTAHDILEIVRNTSSIGSDIRVRTALDIGPRGAGSIRPRQLYR